MTGRALLQSSIEEMEGDWDGWKMLTQHQNGRLRDQAFRKKASRANSILIKITNQIRTLSKPSPPSKMAKRAYLRNAISHRLARPRTR